MRCLLRVVFDTEAGNRALADGTLPKVLRETMDVLKPEAAYFGTEDGRRGGWMFVDFTDPADMPRISEPLFRLGASVMLLPVMDVSDLEKGLTRIQR